ncbi:MAG: TetR/AcrR family transcriptional regulator [Lactobacillaceae bacterium]|jgi:AcrR family transcriptional regulator|nr:TetR/AcrR family transcriptional regulator [Lactobacillaceae bacterium]
MKHEEQNQLTTTNIKNAFIQLIDQKGFNAITVADVTRTAGVSRGTFYVHYLDKFDLLLKIEDEIYFNIEKIINDNLEETLLLAADKDQRDVPYRIFLQSLDYVYVQRETIQSLFSEKGDPLFFNRIRDMVDDLFTSRMKETGAKFSSVIPQDYSKEIVINNLLNIIRHWLDKTKPETPSKLTGILMASLFLSPNELIEI